MGNEVSFALDYKPASSNRELCWVFLGRGVHEMQIVKAYSIDLAKATLGANLWAPFRLVYCRFERREHYRVDGACGPRARQAELGAIQRVRAVHGTSNACTRRNRSSDLQLMGNCRFPLLCMRYASCSSPSVQRLIQLEEEARVAGRGLHAASPTKPRNIRWQLENPDAFVTAMKKLREPLPGSLFTLVVRNTSMPTMALLRSSYTWSSSTCYRHD